MTTVVSLLNQGNDYLLFGNQLMKYILDTLRPSGVVYSWSKMQKRQSV